MKFGRPTTESWANGVDILPLRRDRLSYLACTDGSLEECDTVEGKTGSRGMGGCGYIICVAY